MKTTVWFENNPPKTETDFQNGVFLQRHQRPRNMCAEILSLNTEVEALLTEAQLPVADLASSRSLNLFGMRDGGRLVGVVGIEVYGSTGLLRSLAVAPAHRNSGLGGS